MQQQNPEYKYYKQLAGTWKSSDGACVVTLTDTVGITVSYGGAVLEGYYGVTPTGISMSPPSQGMMGMMGFAGMPGFGDMTYQHDPSEDIQLKLGDRCLKDGVLTRFNIDFAWHDYNDRLHFDMSDVTTGQKFSLILNRGEVSVTPLKVGEYRCECGQVFSSRFCPNCGAERKENKTFTCDCGFTGPVSNFCPNCGKPYAANNPVTKEKPEAGWTCDKCGATLQTGENCSECEAPIKREQLFVLSEYKSTNPPQSNTIKVYKFSDTKLILQDGGRFRFIPATVIEPAFEIIREYGIDRWEEYKNRMTGLMGGFQSVSYWDGEKMVGTSTNNNLDSGPAYTALRNLFTAARI